ncbi:hypothetical protein ACFRAQ_13250 [Nocardia sp. NPDC056611]|uniref:hypothetical protein n=1 Tax=Nocardia sp. NPDC056611 TaxID=3345877 RepID=UPI003670FD5A
MPTHAERRAAAAAGDSDDPAVVGAGWVVVDAIVVLGWSDVLLLEPHPVRASAANTAVTLTDMAFTDMMCGLLPTANVVCPIMIRARVFRGGFGTVPGSRHPDVLEFGSVWRSACSPGSTGVTGTVEEMVAYAPDSTGGFTWMLSGAKALLEFGIELGAVRDAFRNAPAGLVIRGVDHRPSGWSESSGQYAESTLSIEP